MAISLEKISDMLKKDFVHLGLDKKETKELRAGFNKYIKSVSFIICFRYSSFLIRPTAIIFLFLILSSSAHWLLNLYTVNRTKADKRAIFFG